MSDNPFVARAAARFGVPVCLAVLLFGCVTAPTAPGGCIRWVLALEPRLTLSVTPDGETRPVASVTARPICAKRTPAS